MTFLRDRRRFLLFGPPRKVDSDVHRRRAERLRDAMLDLGPAFVKVGQVLSTRPDIVSPTYAEVLGSLQNEVPEDAGGDPRAVVEEELRDEIDLSTLNPVAGGSLAFVYTVRYDGERVALKVRRPGLQSVIERDLRIIRRLIPFVSVFAAERHRYSIENAADDFEEIIFDELDFDREREMMVEIRENLSDDGVYVPNVYPELSSERILAMEYVTGRDIADEDAFEGVDVTPSEMAVRIATVYLKMGLVDGVFHADPHPGNLAITDGGRLVIYDFGMSERLPPPVQDDIVNLYRALVRRDADSLVDSLIALDILDPTVDRAEVRQVLELMIRNLEGRSEITWRLIVTELTSMLHDFPFRIPPDVMLLIRVGTVGEGVCRQLDPEFDFLAVIRSFLVEQGLLQDEIETLLDDMQADLRSSLPAAVGLPARVDRLLNQLDRGEVVVRTEAVGRQQNDDSGLGLAILAGSLLVASSILAFHDQPYEVGSFALAVGFALVYLLR
nr:AarF/UbiB family protein [Halostella pelagica]